MIFAHVPPQLPSRIPCPLAFIDEAPGDSEVVYGKPLCGGAGKLFDRICSQAGVEREKCLITHVFDRELPGGIKKNCTKEPPFEGAQKIPSVGFLPSDYPEQAKRLRSELEAAQPRVIVTLGATALWAMTGRTTITEMRGTVSPIMLKETPYLLLPTYRPGIIFKQYKMRGTMVNDLRKALMSAEGRAPLSTPKEIWLSPTLEDLEAFWPHLENSSLISTDIETERAQVTKIGFASSLNRAIVIPFVSPLTANHSYWPSVAEESQAWEWVAKVGALPNPKIFQNGGFDNFYLLRLGILMWNWCEDLRLMHHALYPELPKSLAYMMSVYGFERPWKLWSGRNQDEKRDA